MPQVIWKSGLDIVGFQSIRVPQGAEILSAHSQNEEIVIWFKCDSSAPKILRKFAVVGTGQEMPEGEWKFIGTVLTYHGAFVWHVFEQP